MIGKLIFASILCVSMMPVSSPFSQYLEPYKIYCLFLIIGYLLFEKTKRRPADWLLLILFSNVVVVQNVGLKASLLDLIVCLVALSIISKKKLESYVLAVIISSGVIVSFYLYLTGMPSHRSSSLIGSSPETALFIVIILYLSTMDFQKRFIAVMLGVLCFASSALVVLSTLVLKYNRFTVIIIAILSAGILSVRDFSAIIKSISVRYNKIWNSDAGGSHNTWIDLYNLSSAHFILFFFIFLAGIVFSIYHNKYKTFMLLLVLPLLTVIFPTNPALSAAWIRLNIIHKRKT